jgi:hypothetical protein
LILENYKSFAPLLVKVAGFSLPFLKKAFSAVLSDYFFADNKPYQKQIKCR